jgi:hypothetical protein
MWRRRHIAASSLPVEHPSRPSSKAGIRLAFVEFSREYVEGSIPGRFERQVNRYAERRAIKAGARELTCTELNRSAGRIARRAGGPQ